MPDRSVSVVVDEIVEKGYRRLLESRHFTRVTRPEMEAAFTAAGVPAMVEALAESQDALRKITTTCIALSDLLDKPYPDDPRWTPYTRFVKPALQRVERARHRARAVLGGEVQGRADTSELEAENRRLRDEVAALHAERETTTEAIADHAAGRLFPGVPLPYEIKRRLGTGGHAYLVQSATDAIRRMDLAEAASTSIDRGDES